MNTRIALIVSGLLCGLLGGVLAPVHVRAAGQANETYLIDRDVINAGGGISQSSAYINIGSIGQTSPLGSSSNALHVVYPGFWHGKAFTLSIAKSGTGNGTVKDCTTVDDCPGARINCGTDCADFYVEGSRAQLQAFPDAGSTFTQWLVDGVPVTPPFQLYVTRDLTVTAEFHQTCALPSAATLPNPADGAGNQPVIRSLEWADSAGATSYTVAFGTTSPPPEAAAHVTTSTYDPGPLTTNTTYYWRVDAVNACGSQPGTEWSLTTTHAPVITSTSPRMVNRTYQYDVDATDADGDMLTFSLINAPDGMSIDGVTGLIVWTAAPTQVGTFTPEVLVTDSQRASDSQPLSLTVTADTFTTMTVGFLEGVNLRDGATEQDGTVLSLGVGANMSAVTDIVLPNVPNLFTFSALATFYVAYTNGQAVIVPEPGVASMAVEETATGGRAFEDIQAGTLGQLVWATPTDVPVTETTTVVFQRADGVYLKIGHITMNLPEGTITCSYADVTP